MSTIDITRVNALCDRETDDVPVILMILKHASLVDPVRLCTDNAERFEDIEAHPVYGITSTVEDGVTPQRYMFCPVSFTLPSQHSEEANTAKVTIDNTDRRLVETIRSAQLRQGYPTLRFIFLLVTPDDPDSKNRIMADFPDMNITNITYTRSSITVELTVSNLNGEPFPGRTFTPSAFPSLGGMS